MISAATHISLGQVVDNFERLPPSQCVFVLIVCENWQLWPNLIAACPSDQQSLHSLTAGVCVCVPMYMCVSMVARATFFSSRQPTKQISGETTTTMSMMRMMMMMKAMGIIFARLSAYSIHCWLITFNARAKEERMRLASSLDLLGFNFYIYLYMYRNVFNIPRINFG